jgi:hypothetical protein
MKSISPGDREELEGETLIFLCSFCGFTLTPVALSDGNHLIF